MNMGLLEYGNTQLAGRGSSRKVEETWAQAALHGVGGILGAFQPFSQLLFRFSMAIILMRAPGINRSRKSTVTGTKIEKGFWFLFLSFFLSQPIEPCGVAPERQICVDKGFVHQAPRDRRWVGSWEVTSTSWENLMEFVSAIPQPTRDAPEPDDKRGGSKFLEAHNLASADI